MRNGNTGTGRGCKHRGGIGMFFRKKKDNSKKESVQKRQRKLEKLEDMGTVSSFTQRLRETWRKQNLG